MTEFNASKITIDKVFTYFSIIKIFPLNLLKKKIYCTGNNYFAQKSVQIFMIFFSQPLNVDWNGLNDLFCEINPYRNV